MGKLYPEKYGRWIAMTLLIYFTGIFFPTANFAQGCVSNCEVKCISDVNISVDQNCEATITPNMVGKDIDPSCNHYYTVNVFDQYGNLMPYPIVNTNHIGQRLKFELIEPECGNKCWGYLNVVDEFPPQIVCGADVTLACTGAGLVPPPTAVENCNDFEIILVNETQQQLTCDPDYTNIITRTYVAVDLFGNTSMECTQTITLERVDLSSIVFPAPKTVDCNDENIDFDENGYPSPLPLAALTGSGTMANSGFGTGVPIYCSPTVSNGYFCALTGSGTGLPLFPTVPDIVCNTMVTYTDMELPGTDCGKKIIRTWEVREWWCTAEMSMGGMQFIEITDTIGPEMTCPQDFTVTTNDDCAADVALPAITATDACGVVKDINVLFDVGFLFGNGGMASLPVGINTVTYIATDQCNNSSTCSFEVTVDDLTEPVVICDQFTVVSISSDGNTYVEAEAFDDGTWDECGLDRLEVRRMDDACNDPDNTTFGPYVRFCCADVGDDIMVILKAWDKAGNHNECMVVVEVQDKTVPFMTCPDDVTIDCREGYDLNNLGPIFGDPVITDNCSSIADIEETVTADVDNCGNGSIERLFELKDAQGNVVRSCQQIITLDNTEPFVLGDIIWPQNYDASNECSIEDLDPADLPTASGFPRFLDGDDACSLIGMDWEDQVFQGVVGTDACVKIIRTWTVIDWCTQVNGVYVTFTYDQVIKLTNTRAPEITSTCENVVFETLDLLCRSGDVTLTQSADDDCTPADQLIWRAELDLYRDDIIDSETPSNTIQGNYPVGLHSVRWVVRDGCGNETECTQDFEVKSIKTPIPVCINGLSAELVPMDLDNDGTPDAEMVTVWANDFDAGSYHSCANPIVVSLSSDTNVDHITYDCSDIGIQPVQMWVTDLVTGNQDYCVTFIDIQDNNTVSVCSDPQLVVVEGEVFTETAENIEEVEVSMGDTGLMQMTDENGAYAFDGMPTGGNYLVYATKDKDYLNGVSTLDLVYMQRHVLGIETLDSPYKLIAADVNRSGDVSALDLLELRKLILGVYETLPQNKSWRFIDAGHIFDEPENPWSQVFPEHYSIAGLSTDMTIDFIGVKVGDVNNSASGVRGQDGDSDLTGELVMSVDQGLVSDNQVTVIPFYSRNFNDMYGLQFTLQFNADDVEVLDVRSAGLDIDETNVNLGHVREGWFSMSWNLSQKVSLQVEEPLFEVVVKARKAMQKADIFELSSSVTRTQAYNDAIVGIVLETPVVEQAEIISVSPNPMTERTQIRFSMPQSSFGVWRFYDVGGRLLHTESAHYAKGDNAIDVLKRDINAEGIIHAEFESGKSKLGTKIMVIN